LTLLFISPTVRPDFKEATVVKVERGVVTFEVNGTQHALAVGLSLKGYDGENKEYEGPFVVRLFVPGNVLAVKTGKQFGKEVITEVRLLRGKVAEMSLGGKGEAKPINPKEASLSFVTRKFSTEEWEGYFKNAKVGDFIEYHGRGRDEPPSRKEILEVHQDHLILFHLIYLFNTPDASRQKWVYDAPKAASKPAEKAKRPPEKSTSKRPPGKRVTPPVAEKKTETLTVAGKELVCEVKETRLSKGETHKKWFCPEVPFGGLVKEEIRGKVTFEVVDFGRGE
jgi:hypothetical protein